MKSTTTVTKVEQAFLDKLPHLRDVLETGDLYRVLEVASDLGFTLPANLLGWYLAERLRREAAYDAEWERRIEARHEYANEGLQTDPPEELEADSGPDCEEET